MKLSAEIIQERMFDDFKQKLKEFHTKREDEYVRVIREKYAYGDESPFDTEYLDKIKQQFKEDTPFSVLGFVKNYVMNVSDDLADAYSNKLIDKEEYEVAFSVLKYMLIAAEMDVDASTKLKDV